MPIPQERNKAKAVEARRLRAVEGISYPVIAERLGVHERTVIRWIKIEEIENQAQSPTAVQTWPEEHRWPGWTVDQLADLSDFDRDLWEGNIGLIRTAEAQNNYYPSWFFRRRVELARSHTMPDGSLDWAIAMAGLPVLGHWLDCPPCTELLGMIEAYKPWQGIFAQQVRNLGVYRREARGVASSVRLCVLQSQARLLMGDVSPQSAATVPVLLAALAERVPVFHRIPQGSQYRNIRLGEIILGILVTPKGG